jgi:hypothetical protein
MVIVEKYKIFTLCTLSPSLPFIIDRENQGIDHLFPKHCQNS